MGCCDIIFLHEREMISMHAHKETQNFCWCIISQRLKMEELAAQKLRAQGRKKEDALLL
jgi:hypothetical protein